jgi:hypothetical protein
LVDKGHLAEYAARSDALEDVYSFANLDLPLEHREHAVAGISFMEHVFSGLKAPNVGLPAEQIENGHVTSTRVYRRSLS